MSIPKYLSLIANQELYLTRVDQLDDKAEILVTRKEIEYWTTLFNADIQKWANKQRKKVYVNCWTVSDYESSTMWGAFADNSTGIAIKTSISRLQSCYLGKKEIDLAIVNYINYETETVQPEGEPINTIRFFSTKRSFYSNEHEIRLIYESHGGKAKTGIAIPVNLDVLIDEIHVAPNAQSWFVQTIERITNSAGYVFPILLSDLIYNR